MAPGRDSMLRSADMSMVQLYISNEIGREVVTALGELGLVQFSDVRWKLTDRPIRLATSTDRDATSSSMAM